MPTMNLANAPLSSDWLILDTGFSIQKTLGQRAQASFVLLDTTATHTIAKSSQVQIYDDSSNLLFAGFVHDDKRTRATYNSGILHTIQCKDNHYLAEKRVAAKVYTSTTTDVIVNDLISSYLRYEGITVGQINTGASVHGIVLNCEKSSQALERLAKMAGMYWYIDDQKRLYFLTLSTGPAAPFAVTSDLIDYDYEVSVYNSNDLYRNQQIIKGGKGVTTTQTETRHGDGVSRSWSFGFGMAKKPTVTVNSVSQTVSTKGNTGAQWYWQEKDAVLTQDSGQTVLVSTDTLVVTYVGYFDAISILNSQTAIAQMGAAEGSSGIVENVLTDNKVHDLNTANTIGQGLLNYYAVDGETVTFTTRQYGLDIGQSVSVTIPELIYGPSTILVQQLGITLIGSIFYYTIVATNMMGN